MRPRPSFSTALLPALLVTALILSGCGSSKKASTAASTNTSSTTTFNPDNATAAKLVVTQADLPTGWTKSTATTDQNNLAAGIYDQLTSCLTGSSDTSNRTLLYSGETFSMNSSAVSSGVTALKTPELASAELADLNKSSNYTCITSLFDSLVGSALASNSAGGIPKSTIAPIPGVTASANAFNLRITTTLTIAGNPQTVFTDIVGVVQGRFVSSATIENFGTATDPALDNLVLQKLTDHARSAA